MPKLPAAVLTIPDRSCTTSLLPSAMQIQNKSCCPYWLAARRQAFWLAHTVVHAATYSVERSREQRALVVQAPAMNNEKFAEHGFKCSSNCSYVEFSPQQPELL